jgi:hypothetical protein
MIRVAVRVDAVSLKQAVSVMSAVLFQHTI